MTVPTGTVSLTPSVGTRTRWFSVASVWASPSVRPVNVGTTTGGGAFAIVMVTVLPGSTIVPGTGSWSMTRPGLAVSLTLNSGSTSKPASSSSCVARSCVNPITFATGNGVVVSSLLPSRPCASR